MRQHRPSLPGFAMLVPSQLATLPRRSSRANPVSPSIWEIQVVGIGGGRSPGVREPASTVHDDPLESRMHSQDAHAVLGFLLFVAIYLSVRYWRLLLPLAIAVAIYGAIRGYDAASSLVMAYHR
jgi:hypothetical protein